jgi:hypothetical protein
LAGFIWMITFGQGSYMETITIQLLNQKALKLLKQLEELHLIKVMKREKKSSQKLSEQFRGKLSRKTAEVLQKQIAQSRKEWDRI